MARKPGKKRAPRVADTVSTIVIQPPQHVVGSLDVPKARKKIDNLPRDPITGKVLPPTKPPKREAQTLQEAASEAFNAVGAGAWLRKQAREYPKEFMSLLARVASEEGAAGGIAYVAVPIPVEVRELPGGALEPVEVDPLL